MEWRSSPSWRRRLPVRSLSDDLLERLVARLGTPLYVYHTDIIGRRLADLQGFDVIR